MAWWMAIPAIVAAGAEVYKGVRGFQQGREGRKALENAERPNYEIPQELKQQLGIAQTRYADPTAPGELMGRQRADLALANTLGAAQQTGQASALLPAAQAQNLKAQQDLTTFSAQQQQMDLQNLNKSLASMAQARDMQFQMNEFAPYADEQQRARDLVGAGEKNLYGAISGVAALGTSLAGAFAGRQEGTEGITDPATGTTTSLDPPPVDGLASSQQVLGPSSPQSVASNMNRTGMVQSIAGAQTNQGTLSPNALAQQQAQQQQSLNFAPRYSNKIQSSQNPNLGFMQATNMNPDVMGLLGALSKFEDLNNNNSGGYNLFS